MKADYQMNGFIRGNWRLIGSLAVLVLMLPLLVVAGVNIVRFSSLAAPVPADIVVDAARLQGALSRPWQGLSQGGEQEQPGQLVSIAPVSTQVRGLGTKYIRIDHVLEEPFGPALQQRITDIINAGAVPFIAISYFPRGVAGSDVGTVSNWAIWQAKVTELVQTVSGRDGMNISGVYYEVWNEPDGPTFGNFNIGTGKDYFTLYQKTVEAAGAAQNVNAFKIGGPALADLRRCTDGLLFVCREYWLDRFLGLVARSGARLDFVSWHKYATKLSDYQDDTNFILNIMTNYRNLPKAEKIITEWGSDPGRNPIHNSIFDAAHTVSAARAFVGYVDLATKFEVRDGPGSGGGGWGVVYHDGTIKPAYTALKLLNLLREQRLVVSGEGTNVTGIASRDNSGVTVILSNYDAGGYHTEKVPVKIINLLPGTYRLTKQIINSVNPLGKEETVTTATSGIFQTTETMLPNSVVLYDLQLIGLAGE